MKKMNILMLKRCIELALITNMADDSSLYNDYYRILKEYKIRYDELDDDLKSQLDSLMGNDFFSILNKVVSLFASSVKYPEMSEDVIYITFDKLSNNCIKKILSQTFNLTFKTDDEKRLIIHGENNDGVIFAAYYFQPQKTQRLDFHSKNSTKKQNLHLPIHETLINLFPKMSQMEMELPMGYFS
jgi:hypothetical protein